MPMQVPDSFYYGKTNTDDYRRNDSKSVYKPGDDSYRRVMDNDRERSKTKQQTDVDSGKENKSFAEVSDKVEKRHQSDKKKSSLFDLPSSKKETAGNVKGMRQGVAQAETDAPTEEVAVNEEGGGESFDEILAKPSEHHEKASLESLFKQPMAKEVSHENGLTQQPQTPALPKVLEQGQQPQEMVEKKGREGVSDSDVVQQQFQVPDKMAVQKQGGEAHQSAAFLFLSKKERGEETAHAPTFVNPQAKDKKGSDTAPTAKGQPLTERTHPEQSRAMAPTGKPVVPVNEEHLASVTEAPAKEQAPTPAPAVTKPQPTRQAEVQPVVERPIVERQAVKAAPAVPVSESVETKPKVEPFKPKNDSVIQAPYAMNDGAKQGDTLRVAEQPAPPRPPMPHKMSEMVKQIIDEIQTISDKGVNETTITIKYPPLFSGVKVTIQTFDFATKELNVYFTNLTGPGKRLLDDNLAALKSALEHNDKGFIVHQLTTSTVSEPTRYTAEAHQQQRDQQQQDDQQQQQQKKKQQQQEDEQS